VAPRPLLLVNTDSDGIFPLDGVMRTHAALRRLYRVLDAQESLGLVIGPGPHKDTQNLQVPVFRWMNQHLKGEDPPIVEAAQPAFEPEELKVFDTLPEEERTTHIHDSFVSVAAPAEVPADEAAWNRQREAWVQALRTHCFAGWPSPESGLVVRQIGGQQEDGVVLTVLEFMSQPHVPLRIYLLGPAHATNWTQVELRVVDDHRFSDPPKPDEADPVLPHLRSPKNWMGDYKELLAMLKPAFGGLLQEELRSFGRNVLEDPLAWRAFSDRARGTNTAVAFFVPRGGGLYSWEPDVRKQIQIRRRFMLLGQTLHGMRVWDIRRAAEVLRSLPSTKGLPLIMTAERWSAVDTLYASLEVPDVAELRLMAMPSSHQDGPDYLNVLRILDIPQALAMAAGRAPVVVAGSVGSLTDASYATQVAKRLGWGEKRIQYWIDTEAPQ
jgi:hypothetical protein